MHPSLSKIAYEMSPSCQPTLSVSGWSISPICDHGGPSQSPKTSRDTPKGTKFSFVHALRGQYAPLPQLNVCHGNLLFLCLAGVYYPFVTIGAPLSAPKQEEIRPKEPSFPLSTLQENFQGIDPWMLLTPPPTVFVGLVVTKIPLMRQAMGLGEHTQEG